MTEPQLFQGLTPEEHYAMRLSAELAETCREIIGDGPQSQFDWNELAIHIHAVQNTILRQAAAREYPELYRLLGQSLSAIANVELDSEPDLEVEGSVGDC